MSESAREEALRLAREAGLYLDANSAEHWRGNTDALMRLIALARQRPGWVWAPEDLIRQAWERLSIVAKTNDQETWDVAIKLEEIIDALEVLATAPKPGEGT
jgi:hypothetical protein